jgi:hypothetical protein
VNLPEFEEEGWNDERMRLQSEASNALGKLMEHGGTPVQIPVITPRGDLYLCRMEWHAQSVRCNG